MVVTASIIICTFIGNTSSLKGRSTLVVSTVLSRLTPKPLTPDFKPLSPKPL